MTPERLKEIRAGWKNVISDPEWDARVREWPEPFPAFVNAADDVRELLAALDAAEKKFNGLVRGNLLAQLESARKVVEAARPFASSNYPELWGALKRYDKERE